ncbi:ATP-binding protein [Krasilnikoviella flava]|uniref:Histidine kinase-like ATPase domain-containing protein n=1 Tax=Krasilnikoviella flava TaxID=526729 RepID=A0A1T5J2N0_9MICO|nr:ATP-binding protein [Krasilnikoviella flava]SKC45493.1 Histidine kinase-like ATPase domain-containing protein [Krasilnikoviella flava]
MSPREGVPPRGLAVVGSWTLRTVDELADVRAELEARLPCHCEAAATGPAADVGGLSGRQQMVLVASELVANALEHARPPVTARLLCDGRVAVLDVVDRSPDRPPVVPQDREPGEGGHGLRLAETIADRVGWYRTDHGEKHVWAQFASAAPLAGATPAVGPVALVAVPAGVAGTDARIATGMATGMAIGMATAASYRGA